MSKRSEAAASSNRGDTPTKSECGAEGRRRLQAAERSERR